MTDRPWDFDTARQKNNEMTRRQASAEEFVKTAYRQYAEAERAYREALATKIVELRADGYSVTLCADVARGDKHVAQLKYARDVAEGVREAAGQAAWRASADRRATESFTTWSMRRDLAEGFVGVPADREFSRPIGARA